MTAFKAATPDALATFVKTIGPAVAFDTIIAPAL
jgi:hypothetical protein